MFFFLQKQIVFDLAGLILGSTKVSNRFPSQKIVSFPSFWHQKISRPSEIWYARLLGAATNPRWIGGGVESSKLPSGGVSELFGNGGGRFFRLGIFISWGILGWPNTLVEAHDWWIFQSWTHQGQSSHRGIRASCRRSSVSDGFFGWQLLLILEVKKWETHAL